MCALHYPTGPSSRSMACGVKHKPRNITIYIPGREIPRNVGHRSQEDCLGCYWVHVVMPAVCRSVSRPQLNRLPCMAGTCPAKRPWIKQGALLPTPPATRTVTACASCISRRDGMGWGPCILRPYNIWHTDTTGNRTLSGRWRSAMYLWLRWTAASRASSVYATWWCRS